MGALACSVVEIGMNWARLGTIGRGLVSKYGCCRSITSSSGHGSMVGPTNVKYAIVGAGVHGLSTAYHLALKLKETGRGSGKDILVVDKTAIAAGASGIACGVIRNNYYQPAMRELMAHSVSVWESDPKAYSYHPVGYMQISPEIMHEQVGTIYEQ